MDTNGSSDPYCVSKMGKHRVKTKAIKKELNPVWNETFIFPAKDVEAAVDGSAPRISFSLWDSDILGKDEFLGQVTSSQVSVRA